MPTCRVRVLAGRRGTLLTNPYDSVNPNTFGDGGSGQGQRAELCLFNAEERFLEMSVGEDIYIQDFKGISSRALKGWGC